MDWADRMPQILKTCPASRWGLYSLYIYEHVGVCRNKKRLCSKAKKVKRTCRGPAVAKCKIQNEVSLRRQIQGEAELNLLFAATVSIRGSYILKCCWFFDLGRHACYERHPRKPWHQSHIAGWNKSAWMYCTVSSVKSALRWMMLLPWKLHVHLMLPQAHTCILTCYTLLKRYPFPNEHSSDGSSHLYTQSGAW